MKLNLRIFAIFLFGFFLLQPGFSVADNNDETIQLTLVISSGDDINLTATKRVEKGLNSFEAISQLVIVGSKETSYGPQIMSLAGIEAVENNYWALYVNSKMSMVGAQDVILLDDTFIRLNMEAF